MSPATHAWKFYPRHPPADAVQFDTENKAYMLLHRCQLPLTNTFAMTHYTLQGQTLPALILDLARPPAMKPAPRLFQLFSLCSPFLLGPVPHSHTQSQDDYWIACLVLLSRVRHMDDLLLLRLPDFTALNRPRPAYLREAYITFHKHETSTLHNLDAILAKLHLQDLRNLVTLPLLQSRTSSRAIPVLPRRQPS